MGLNVINVSESLGVVRQLHTTFWFGFKDDLVSEFDLKPICLYRTFRLTGGSNRLGVNARRIRVSLIAFDVGFERSQFVQRAVVRYSFFRHYTRAARGLPYL